MSHISVETASAYLEWTGDPTPQIRRDAASLRPAAVIQLAIALLEAAHVMSPLLAGDPLRPSIGQALTDLRLQGTQLFVIVSASPWISPGVGLPVAVVSGR